MVKIKAPTLSFKPSASKPRPPNLNLTTPRDLPPPRGFTAHKTSGSGSGGPISNASGNPNININTNKSNGVDYLNAGGNFLLKAVPIGAAAYLAVDTVGWAKDGLESFLEAVGDGISNAFDGLGNNFDNDGDGQLEFSDLIGGASDIAGSTFSYITEAANNAAGAVFGNYGTVLLIGGTVFSGYFVYTRFIK